MTDPVIRPGNGLLLIALQPAEGTPATPSAATDVILYDVGSINKNGPFKTEAVNEANGSLASGAPLVIGQPATFSFRSRIKGANAVYTASVKPPLHAPLSACGWLGVFTAAVASAALSAGTTTSATLAGTAAATAQIYRGQPLLLTGAPAAGRWPLISDYTAGKVATLTDQYVSPLSTSNQGAIPANWTYSPTTPVDAASRATMHPCATIYYYEDGVLYQYMDCRGVVDFDGASARPGYAAFTFSGVFVSKTDVAMPANPVYPTQSAPLLLQGSGTGPVAQVNRRGLPISKWSLKQGGQIESPDDPNSAVGFGGGNIVERTYVLEVDPLRTLVATRNVLTDIGNFSQYTTALQFGSIAGNRVSLMQALAQPTDVDDTDRGSLGGETIHYQSIPPGRDNASRDGDVYLCFS